MISCHQTCLSTQLGRVGCCRRAGSEISIIPRNCRADHIRVRQSKFFHALFSLRLERVTYIQMNQLRSPQLRGYIAASPTVVVAGPASRFFDELDYPKEATELISDEPSLTQTVVVPPIFSRTAKPLPWWIPSKLGMLYVVNNILNRVVRINNRMILRAPKIY
jgi:hypothetical protein